MLLYNKQYMSYIGFSISVMTLFPEDLANNFICSVRWDFLNAISPQFNVSLYHQSLVVASSELDTSLPFQLFYLRRVHKFHVHSLYNPGVRRGRLHTEKLFVSNIRYFRIMTRFVFQMTVSKHKHVRLIHFVPWKFEVFAFSRSVVVCV